MQTTHLMQTELMDDARIVLNLSKKVLTYAFEEVPPWMQGDPFIRRGYRNQLGHFTECFWSLFYLHNESINTWSHLLAAVYFLTVIVRPRFITAEYDKFSRTDKRVLLLYNLGTAGCSIFSAFFHVSNSHSQAVANRLLKLDYLGITLTISTTAISATCLGLVSDPKARVIYVSLQLLCASVVSAVMMSPDMDGTQAAFWRSLVFTCLAASGIAPMIHMSVQSGWHGLRNFSVLHIGTTCLCYAIGMTVYVTRVPEKIWPGIFDIWGASHQIFHLLVSFGQFFHLVGLRSAVIRRT